VITDILKFIMHVPFSVRQARLARSRRSLSKDDFVREIGLQGGDADAAAFIWDLLREWTNVDGFTPYPMDSFASVFGLAEEELEEDLIVGVLRLLNARMPDQQDASAFGPIDTPLQAAKFVAVVRKAREG
jgi:hypothetical protein